MEQRGTTNRTLKDTIIIAIVFCTIIGGFTFLAAAAELNHQMKNSESFAQGYSDYPSDDKYNQVVENANVFEDIDSFFYVRGFETAKNDEMMRLPHRDVIHG